MYARPSADWWWAELRGVRGYAPASYLRREEEEEEEEDVSVEDPWQDEEYFGSYGTLVRKIHSIFLWLTSIRLVWSIVQLQIRQWFP